MTAAPLRYPVGDNGHRPFPYTLAGKVGPDMGDHLNVAGCGYWSPELAALVREFGREKVAAACAALNVRPIRQNVGQLRRHLEEGRQ